ncbi:MAG: MarR family transcriptional regulator [Cyclobacteriaceae bacterium]|nr:MarR family transcriptional regulator [Cyclobacteriaceae bacterium]
MKLEQAIKQNSFSQGQRLGLNLIYTFNWIKNKQKEYFSPFDITAQQYNVLRILRGKHPDVYSTSGIRDRMLDKMSDASRIVDRLLIKHLVERSVNKADKRLVDIKISLKGIKLLDAMNPSIEKNIQKLFERLSTEEQELLDQLLDKMRG